MGTPLPPGLTPDPPIPGSVPRPKMKVLALSATVAAGQSAVAEGLRQQGHTGKAAALDLASATVGVVLQLAAKSPTAQAVGQAMVLAPASSLGRNYGGPLVASFIPKKQEKGTTSDFTSYASASQGQASQAQTQTQASLQEQRAEVQAQVPAKAG